jgi:hypothetical protein
VEKRQEDQKKRFKRKRGGEEIRSRKKKRG